MDPAPFVFLDGTGASTSMARPQGWAPKGGRPVDAALHGHGCTTTFVAGLRATGLIAPPVPDGPMTGAVLRASVGQVLAPGPSLGDVAGMDDLAAHKVAGPREAVTAVGAGVLCLPPDLNPIKPMFAMLKARLGKTAARTRDAL
ncbi:MAG: transposase [Geminicoccaceae bacterium]|nr:transposase [Geminicoccaceae bacterium]